QIGLAAIAVWFGLAHALPWVWTGERWRVLVGLAVFLLLVIAAIGSWNLLAELWQVYRWAPPHSLEHRNQFWFYHLLLLNRYPAVWPFFPLIAIIALAAKPRPALFCLCMFVLVFVLESFGGMKDQRYLFFAMPFLYALCGMALAQILGPLWRWLNAATDRAATALLPSAWRRPAKWLALGASALFLIGANGSTAKTALMFAGVRLSADGDGIGIGQEHDGDAWSAASAALEPWLEQASLVMTMGEEFTLYYLGDYDILIDRNRVVELGDHEFIVDPRNGRPIVSKPSSVQRILDCYPDGVIIVDSKIWRQPNR